MPSTGVRYLDGPRLRRATAAAARWVSQRQENLNGINVFPVPDGDTGTNLAATLVSAAERAGRVRERTLGAVSRALADGALFGACGNSGAIVAQFLEGFAAELEGVPRAGADRLGRAARAGSQAAYGALSRPREGTILTVMRAWAERFVESGAEADTDLLEALRQSLAAARESLARTPEQLKELARAGVVDAGAQGFVYFLEGILHFAEGRIAGIARDVEGAGATAIERASIVEDTGSIEFRYCTEFLLEGEGLAIGAVRDAVAGFGDSLVVAGSPRRIRVHLHTDRPEQVFAVAAGHGRVVRTKADDMHLQHAARFDRGRVAIVTDSAADLPGPEQQRLRVHVVPLRILLGSQIYLDKETLVPDEVYDRLVRGERAVRTSQPPPGDYMALFEYLFEHYGSIVVLSLSGTFSGTLAAARTAAKKVGPDRIAVVDTGAASIGQGLVVREAAERAQAGADVEEVVAAAEDARRRVRMVVGAPTLEYFVRGGRIGGWKAKIAGWLRVVPILRVDAVRGTIGPAGFAREGRVHRRTLAKVVAEIRAESPPPERVWVAHAAAPEAADGMRMALADAAPAAEVAVMDVGPALGAHAGPGTVAVAWLSPAGLT